MGLISGLLFFVAFLPYGWSIVQGQTVPSPISWSIWASLDTLVLIAMMKKKANVGQVAGATAGAWIITLLAIVYGGVPTIGIMEIVSLAIAVLGIILWQLKGDALAGIVWSMLAALSGSIPTFLAAWNNPSQEDPIAWSIWFVSCIFALFAVRKWDLANAAQPVTFTLIETTMVVLVVVRPWMGW